jgi:hypothetical protein
MIKYQIRFAAVSTANRTTVIYLFRNRQAVGSIPAGSRGTQDYNPQTIVVEFAEGLRLSLKTSDLGGPAVSRSADTSLRAGNDLGNKPQLTVKLPQFR